MGLIDEQENAGHSLRLLPLMYRMAALLSGGNWNAMHQPGRMLFKRLKEEKRVLWKTSQQPLC